MVTATMPPSVKSWADAYHEQVALVRKGAAAMDVDLSEMSDLDVLAILHWCEKHTPPPLEASKTMLGLIATMGGAT